MTTDEQLMLDFQQGSREAFAELFDRYRDAVYGYFRRRLAHASRAEELAQETFLAVLEGARPLRTSGGVPQLPVRHRVQSRLSRAP